MILPSIAIALALISLAATALAIPIQLAVECRDSRGRDPRFHVFHCDRCRRFLSDPSPSLRCPHCGTSLQPLKV
ncbi:MAG: hypothetical protein LBT98_03555 [Puniceicoccales bacterium]|jgi:rRNA maturation endonuclease Nob1|nr:hypothetical protein [Puniceicoccales bacterium]